MIRGSLLATCLLVTATAHADPKHVLVLKSDGNVDAKTHAQLDATILRLAKGVEGVAPGDISFGDAAAAVGCKPDAPACKDDVLGMLGVDEVITSSATRKPGGLEVVVRRAPKTGSPREATAKVSDLNDPQLEAAIGPLFGAAAPDKPPPPPDKPPPPPDKPPPPPDKPIVGETGDVPPPPVHHDAPPTKVAEPTKPEPLPPGPPVDEGGGHQRLELAGMIGGGSMILIGFVMWGQASGTQNSIDMAPSRTKADLLHIQDLENQGDSQASVGNLLFIGGLVLGGVSTYFYIRDRGRHPDRQARIVPTVFDHGAGVALTFGGLP